MRQTVFLLKKNWRPLLGFELAYHVLALFVFQPVYYMLFQLSIRLTGLTYLSTESIAAYLRHPAGSLFLVFISVSLPLIAIFNMAAVMECFYASHRKERISVVQMLRAGARDFLRIWTRGNILLIPLAALLVPLSCLATSMGYSVLREIPSFVLDYIWHSPLLAAVFIGLLLLLLYAAVRLCFSIHAYVVDGDSLLQSAKKSVRLTRGRFFHTLLHVLLWQCVLLAASLLLCAALGLPGILLIRYFAQPESAFYLALLFVWLLADAVFYLFAWLAVAFSFARLSVLYRVYKEALGEPASVRPIVSGTPLRPAVRRGIVLLFCLAALANLGAFLYSKAADFQLTHDLLRLPDVSAHRGDSLTAPENSIPAFQSAITLGADWIELDVHQTKDGVVVVSHDADLKRIAGVKRNIWEMTYDEVQQYDVGSWFSPEYAGLRLATLDEVLKLCKGKIKLNIELKPTGHEENFEQNVIDLVYANGFQNDCVLASLSAECLRRVEQLQPEIITVYNMAVATGKFVDIPYIDGYSIEYSFVTESTVRTIKSHGKDIFVWTINTPSRVEEMMDLYVDNIITDDPTMAKAVIYDGKVNDIISNLLAFFFPPELTDYRTDPAEPAPTEHAVAQM